MIRLSALIPVLALACLAHPTGAQTQPVPLSIEAAQRMAGERDAVHAGLLDAAEAMPTGTWRSALRDPQFRYRYGERDESSPLPGEPRESRRSQSWDLRVYLPHPAVLSAQAHSARAFHGDLESLARSHEQERTLTVLRLYRELQFLERDAALADQIATARAQRLEAIEALNREGLADAPTTVKATIRHAEIIVESQQLRTMRKRLSLQLARLIGLGESENLLLDPFQPLPNTTPLAPLSPELLNEAAERDADLTRLRSRLARTQASLRERRADSIPWVSYIQGEMGQDEEIFLDRESWSVRVAVNIPVFSLWARGHEPEQVELAGIESQLRLRTHSLEAELRDAWSQLGQALAHQAALDEQLAPVLASLRASASPGQTNLIPLDLQAELAEQIASCQRQLIGAQQDAHLALLEFSTLLGRPYTLPATP